MQAEEDGSVTYLTEEDVRKQIEDAMKHYGMMGLSVKRSSDEAEAPRTAIIPQPATKTNKGTEIVLPDDVWKVIVMFVGWRGFRALACACKATRDAARDVDWLARDKVNVLRCWLALGGKEDALKRRYWDKEDDYKMKMRDEPSDDLAEWIGVTVARGRVTELQWDGNNIGEPLTGTIPAEIGALDGLAWLNLHNQICGHLPSEIGRLTSLKGLNLNNNRLEGPLPAELGALTALFFLQLDNNSFTGEVPSTLGNLTNLEFLNLSKNRLEGPLPAELGALTALTQLYLEKNNFTGDIPSTLANLTIVNTLGLSGNNFDTDVPSHLIRDVREAQRFLATLRPNHDMLE